MAANTPFTEAKEEITPDSSKSTGEKAKETFTDTGDRVTRGVQGDESKSTSQEAYDKTQRMKDNNNGGATGTMFVTLLPLVLKLNSRLTVMCSGEKIKDTLGMGGESK